MSTINKDYWNTRYEKGIGSGIGSRGIFAQQKEVFVRKTIQDYEAQSVLDVGCGDIFWIKNIHIENYIGLDFSQKALNENKKLKPSWQFKKTDFSIEPIENHADLVICLDVLIHQSSKEKYNFIVDNLLHVADKVLLVSGWKKPPEKHGATMFFYETIYTTFEKRGLSYREGLEYRESIILEVLKDKTIYENS